MPAHCSAGCNVGYGLCDGVSTAQSFRTAMKNGGKTDEVLGGQWYWDAAARLFWTWDTPELMARKFDEIVMARGLGGVMAWSLAEDSFGNWPRLAAMKQGVEKMKRESY
jgi:GH18 family chitinase